MDGIVARIEKSKKYASQKQRSLKFIRAKASHPDHLTKTRFVSQELLLAIYKIKNVWVTSFRVFHCNVNLVLTKKTKQYIIDILTILHLISDHLPKKLNIYLYLTPVKKTLAQNCHYMPANINSGYSYFTHNKEFADIVVFRREDWFKVFIHECFHAAHLDFAISYKHQACQIVELPQSLPYETYCETWARILDSLINVSEIEKQKQHSLAVAKKIMSVCNMSAEDYLANKLYTEDTNMFCYYLLTAAVINHYKEFIEWCEINNSADILCYQGDCGKFTDFALSMYKSASFNNALKRCQKHVSGIPMSAY